MHDWLMQNKIYIKQKGDKKYSQQIQCEEKRNIMKKLKQNKQK